jgi:hypothetical protein
LIAPAQRAFIAKPITVPVNAIAATKLTDVFTAVSLLGLGVHRKGPIDRDPCGEGLYQRRELGLYRIVFEALHNGVQYRQNGHEVG